jgi:MFS transporter, AAHS family, 3-hydroxyphenylpropionic acid transporter
MYIEEYSDGLVNARMSAFKMGGPSAAAPVRFTIALCFVAAVFEGLDIQSMGVAAPRLAPAFHLGPGQLGIALSASTFGLMLGAGAGGWFSDRVGRKPVLIVSMICLGVFSLVTTIAGTIGKLLLIRAFAGIGLGGAFPTLIALVSEITSSRSRVTALACVYCGLPVGGIVAGLVAAVAPDWRYIFYVGGFGPLIFVPVLARYLSNPTQVHRSESATRGQISWIFGSRTRTTLLLWMAYFFTLLVVYVLLNWLPSLVLGRGYSHTKAAASSVVLNIGAVVGSLFLGYVSDRGRSAAVLNVTYVGMIAALLLLALPFRGAFLPGAFAAGFFVIGGQLVLYAIAPTLYPTSARGTGVGAAVAVGRIGAIVGPLIGGGLLAIGFGPGVVPAAAIPGLIIALSCLLLLPRLDSSAA